MQEIQTSLPIGTVIQGHYIVESLLGKGDFGSVYLVRDQHDKHDQQKLFALAEVVKPNEKEKYRFTLEYVSLAPLDYRALPHVQYMFNDDKLNRAYLLMSYIEGPNLEKLQSQHPEKRFPLAQVMAIMDQVIKAVTYLHHLSPPITHRNINPAAIIVQPEIDEPILVMLDLVKESDSTTTILHYFAPGYGATEQYTGEFDPRSDIYGLGATCYTLLTGIVPSDALYRSIQLRDGKIDPLQPVNEVISTIPLVAAEAIQRAMSVNANDRYSSIEQFWEVLRTSGEPGISLHMPTTPAPSPVASRQAVEISTPTSEPPELTVSPRPAELPEPSVSPRPAVPSQSRTRYASKPGWLLFVLALLLLISLGLLPNVRGLLATHSATPTPRLTPPTPTSTPVSSIYPTPTRTYDGTIFDLSSNVSTSISLSGIRPGEGNISGYLTLGPKLQGSGPFSGTIDIAKRLQFIVTDTTGHALLFFEGNVQAADSLSGDYYRCNSIVPAQGGRCRQAPGSYGIWNVVLNSTR
jgi:serine/threonine protein kinase